MIINSDILDQKKNGKLNERNRKISDETGRANYDLISLFLKHDDNLSPEELLKDIALNFIVKFYASD